MKEYAGVLGSKFLETLNVTVKNGFQVSQSRAGVFHCELSSTW